MLAATDDIRVVAEAESLQQAVREAERARADVIVIDIRLVDGCGIEATREIRDRLPDTKVLMLTSFADDEALHASIMRACRCPMRVSSAKAGEWGRRWSGSEGS
jgi:two-component system response regulator DevR